jgi:HEPN domain
MDGCRACEKCPADGPQDEATTMNRRLNWVRRLPGLLARYYRDAIGFLRRLLGQDLTKDFNWDYFVRSGCEYYATARFAMRAQRSYVCGNLFHHAVEMLLKGELLQRGVSLDELKRTGHSLRKLWRMYKAYYPKADLERHNRTINRLDKYEEIRYPNPALGSIGVAMEWSSEPVPITTFGGLRSPRQYPLTVDAIDDLVANVFRTSPWDPSVSCFMGTTNEAALEAIRRHNAHASFLTALKS